MGIAGLTPFLLKHYPHLIKKLPGRFESFIGKTIALDATLITQRFWYAPDPHHSRHIRGWYRLVSELRKSAVSAICVFDGKGRNVAKQQEVSRREGVRKLLSARAGLEADRARRLKRFTALLGDYASLEPSEKLVAASGIQDVLSALGSAPFVVPFPSFSSRMTTPSIDPTENPLDKDNELPASIDTAVPEPLVSLVQSDLPASPIRKPRKKPTPKLLSRRLAVLFRDYQRTARQELLTPVVSSSSVDDGAPTLTHSDAETPMSRLQADLVTGEGQVWSSLLQTTEDGHLAERLHKLEASSNTLFQSYTKRQSTPTQSTYDEIKILLDAMGVPIVEAPQGSEAEAVAASLCLNGYADVVGSEDTDVLIYEAPLLRNITSGDVPLVEISGKEVRESLQLSREAFVDFALLLGSDFSQRLHGLGPSNAIRLIQSQQSIEAILDSERTKSKGRRFLPEPKLSQAEYLKQVEAGRGIFNTIPLITEEIKDQLAVEREVDEEAVAEIMRGFDLRWDYRRGEEWVEVLEDGYLDDPDFGPDGTYTYV